MREQGFGLFPSAGERMLNAGDRTSKPLDLADHVNLAVSAMNHDRLAQSVRQDEVAIEILLLQRERSAVPITIESCLSEGNDSRIAGKCCDR